MFELRPVDRDKKFTSIVNQIVEGVRTGAFPPGQALPAERLLAAELDVSRSSVREAIRVLENIGIVDVQSGRGTFITMEAVSKATLMRVQAELVGQHSPLDVIVARRALEPRIAGVAALQRHEADVIVLHTRLQEHQRLNEAGENVEEVDLSFHLAIARSCRNPVLFMLFEYLAEVMGQDAWRELKHRSRDHAGAAQRYVDEHAALLAAIERRDASNAAKIMQQHLDTIEKGFLAEI